MINIKLRIDFGGNEIWQKVKENMKQLLVVITKFPKEAFIEVYKQNILGFNIETWCDVKIFKEVEKEIG